MGRIRLVKDLILATLTNLGRKSMLKVQYDVQRTDLLKSIKVQVNLRVKSLSQSSVLWFANNCPIYAFIVGIDKED